ncbi:transglycosylase SLT domain-containing protein [Pelagovum pacificum]|uniref:Lytic transglycosylase domain-containing protein n=1 Tax=Pelagovum pacificum TaxID=2588711 RepID=A0A5C5G7S7_9RHOB|nr:transglycosylase SLT domain-containing protein [Pelagovum pacificum]QQA41794.1 transglycosylase SLT domain-containing protein [Pelagovum pacificum]TNY30764.1 lytic transglycosylase domain-containing protein [Pelagovum pacificum]
MRLPLLALALSALTACATVQPTPEPEPYVPAMRWDHRPEAATWTAASFAAMDRHETSLADMMPGDIEGWCPGYATASRDERAAFWTGLLSALAEHESTWNPDAVGGGGRWYGLVQIDPTTARGYGCQATSGSALRDGAANLSCAVRIATRQVARYGTVSRGMRDWGPFHSSSKRAEMRDWVSQQAYCAPSQGSEIQ